MEPQIDLTAYLKDLETIVNIDSGSSHPAGTARVIDFFRQRFEAIGWMADQHAFDPSIGPCLEVKNGGGDACDFLLIGHVDTVFPVGTCKERPYSVEGDRAHGPGVSDMKSGALLMYYVLNALTQAGALQDIRVCAAFNCDEEIGSRFSRPWLESLARQSRRVFILEGAREDGSLVNQRKGVARYFVRFDGVAAHAGVDPDKGRSAIVEMGHWIVALDALNRPSDGTTLNVGVVSGGTVPNVVADRAEASIDLRFKDPAEARRVDDAIGRLVAAPKVSGVTANVTGGITRPPMIPSPETLALCRKIEAIGSDLGVDVRWVSTGGGSDGNFSAALGIPTIDGLGPRGGRAHSREEFLDIPSIRPHFELLREMIRRL
jgi:glutamate carboxypeptidase